MSNTDGTIPPIRREVTVSWSQAEAFERFTARFADWWPRASHSIGGPLVERIVFDCRVGGQIVEEVRGGRRFLWGTITAFEPPARVAFTWHPSQEPSEAQDVEVSFTPVGGGCRVMLVSSGWERLGEQGRKARRGYDIGWGSVLDAFQSRRSMALRVFGGITAMIRAWHRVTGRTDAEIDKSGGRLA